MCNGSITSAKNHFKIFKNGYHLNHWYKLGDIDSKLPDNHNFTVTSTDKWILNKIFASDAVRNGDGLTTGINSMASFTFAQDIKGFTTPYNGLENEIDLQITFCILAWAC